MKRFFLLFLLFLSYRSFAQMTVPEETAYDPAYIGDQVDDLIVRIYGSNKFTRYAIGRLEEDRWAQYKPNSHYNVGLGFNYRYLGINIGFRAPGINNDFDKYGRTKYLDLQSYLYMRKWTVNFFGQTYKGYYLADNRLLQPASYGPVRGIRPDIHTRKLGLDVEYLTNGRRFSYRAVYLQNERQLRSAGSFILGGGLHYVHTRGDSSLVPAGPEYAFLSDGIPFNRSGAASLSLKAGYAHTLVIARNFFLTGSLVAGAGANFVRLKADASGEGQEGFGFHAAGIGRLGAGYHSNYWFTGVYFTTNLVHDNLPDGIRWQQYETGVLRLVIARRLELSDRGKRRLDYWLPRKYGNNPDN